VKPNLIGQPTQYLGAQIGRYTVPEDPDKPKWFLSSEKYVKEAIRNVQSWLELHKLAIFKSKAPSVLPSGYRPEIDDLELCGSKLAHYYQQQIGVLR
jgi:hypothetical protein